VRQPDFSKRGVKHHPARARFAPRLSLSALPIIVRGCSGLQAVGHDRPCSCDQATASEGSYSVPLALRDMPEIVRAAVAAVGGLVLLEIDFEEATIFRRTTLPRRATGSA
jgi:hypothetical protein